jgi:hypothetical protein
MILSTMPKCAALFGVAFATIASGCGASDEVSPIDAEAIEEEPSSEVQVRWRRWWSERRAVQPSQDSVASGGSTSGTGAPSSGSSGSSSAGSGAEGVVGGSTCPGNQALSGPCPSYGVQCTYTTATGTHYCTCLFSNFQGIQGWDCR